MSNYLLCSINGNLNVVGMVKIWADSNAVLIVALVALMSIDFILGTIVAVMQKRWNPLTAINGLYGKLITVLILAAVAIIDIIWPTIKEYMLPEIVDIKSFSGVVITFLCIKEIHSLVKNYMKAGKTLPKILTKLFLDEQEDNKSDHYKEE